MKQQFFDNRIAVTVKMRGRVRPARRARHVRARLSVKGTPVPDTIRTRGSWVSSGLLSREVLVRSQPRALRERGATGRAQQPLKLMVEGSSPSAPTISAAVAERRGT